MSARSRARGGPWTASLLVLLAGTPLAAQSRQTRSTWPTGTPGAAGLDAAVLAQLDADLAAGKYGYVDGMLIIRHGKLVYDRSYPHNYDSLYAAEAHLPGPLNAHDPSGPYNYFNPWWHPFYRRGELHSLQSVTKTITSILVGIAIGRGDFPQIDTPVLQFFDTTRVKHIDDRKRRMTVRHLLTMTTGLDWNEDLPYSDPTNSSSVMEASFDWVQYTIDRPMRDEPGRVFVYSSGATQLLSHIFRVATGRDIEQYAQQYLFAPLDITQWFWKRTPTGLADTEGGLYLELHDLAKVPYLFLRHGAWNGKTVVPAGWVSASVAPAIAVDTSRGGTDGVRMGYLWWLYPEGDAGPPVAWAGSGFGGQRPIAFPGYDMVVVFTGWNVLPDRPALTRRTAIERVLAAVRDRPEPSPSR
jgi:CubicO group peptidase (beta-lactamase class C family)